MGDRYMLFGADSFFFLWALSIAGGIAVVPSWAEAEPELDDGVLTRGGRCLVQARALLTVGCMVFWICTILGHVLTDSNGGLFGFWQNHPRVLQTLMFLVDPILTASVIFAWQSRGSRGWILRTATPIVALASIAVSIALYLH